MEFLTAAKIAGQAKSNKGFEHVTPFDMAPWLRNSPFYTEADREQESNTLVIDGVRTNIPVVTDDDVQAALIQRQLAGTKVH